MSKPGMFPSLSRGSEGLREPDSPPPPTEAPRRRTSSIMRSLMRRVSGAKKEEDEDEPQPLSSSGSFGAEMRNRQSLLHNLLSNSDSIRSPSAPSSQNSSPISSPRSSSRSHRPYLGVSIVNSPTALSTAQSSSKGSSISRKSDLMKGFYESSEDSESFGASYQASGPASLASTLTSVSPQSRRRSAGTNSDGSSGSSGSEKVRSMYIKNFSFEIDMRELKFKTNRKGEKRLIGEGAFAKILLAEWNGTPVAVKRMSATQAGKVALERFQSEIALMMSLRHPNITQIFGGCWPPPEEEDGEEDRFCNLFSTCIVMEYCELGSLFDIILRYGQDVTWYPPNYSPSVGGEMDPMLVAAARSAASTSHSHSSPLASRTSNIQFKLDWCRQIARGMTYLHSNKNPIMHRDLKCSNVLVSKGFTLKISDFGESRRRHKVNLEDAEDHTMSQAGTLLFMAPEMVTEHDYDMKVDVYSFAILMLELFNNGDLINFYKTAPALAMHKVLGGWRPDLSRVYKECKEVGELVERCWSQEADDRPTFAEALDVINNIIEDTNAGDIESRRSSIRLSGD